MSERKSRGLMTVLEGREEEEPQPRPSKAAAASIVLGIVSITVGFSVWGSFFGIICGAIGLILGLRCRHESEAGRAGFWASLIGLAISICVAALFIPGFIQAV
ncbi:MAG: hypothetical protein HDQ87_05205 [Clostridia bacterium]|nr:hypothetical protein [Clostridia bacterium]